MDILEKYKAYWKSAQEYARPIWDKRNNNFALYVGSRKKKAKSIANYSVPYVATLVDNVHPLLTQKLPMSSVISRNEKDRDAAKLMNELLKYTFDVNNFEFTFLQTNKESMIYDTGWNKVCWKYGDNVDQASIIPLNTFDIYAHPNKTTLDDDWPIMIRAEMTKEQMKAEGWDEEAINSLGDSKLQTIDYRKQQLQLLGYTEKEINEDKKDDLYEVVEIWGNTEFESGKKMACVVIANNEKIINTKQYKDKELYESPYNHGKIPLAYLPYNPFPHILLGEGFVTPIASLQEELNSLENEKVNNYRRRNNPPLKVRRRGEVDLSTLKFVTSLPWVVNEIDDITMMSVEDLATSIESQQNMIRQQMQNRTGANDVLLVSDTNDLKGGDTALGAAIANENTKMRFRPQATLIDLYVERIGELLISMYQDPNFFDRDKAIAIADEEGQFSETIIKPANIQGDLQFKVLSNSSLAESNNAKLNKYLNLRELYAEDPTKNLDELDRIIFEAADLDPNKIMRGAEEMTGDLVVKLKQLISVTQQPGFEQAPENQRQDILAQIDKIKTMIGQNEQVGSQNGSQDEGQNNQGLA